MSAICCTDYLNFGCYSLCDASVSNINVVATVTGTYTITFALGGITHTVMAAGIEDEPLTFENIFPVGITYFTITDPAGESICYYLTIERHEAICPEVLTDTKTLSTC